MDNWYCKMFIVLISCYYRLRETGVLSKTRHKYVTLLISLEFIASPSMQIARITGVRKGSISAGATSRMAYAENKFLKLEKI